MQPHGRDDKDRAGDKQDDKHQRPWGSWPMSRKSKEAAQ
jgi:hypothetical protein